MQKQPAVGAVIVIAVILSLAACGSNNGGSTPPAGSQTNPIVIPANAADNQFSEVYNGTVGTGSIYFKMTGLIPINSYLVMLANLTADADLFVYPDAFVTQTCSSIQTGTTTESCSANTNAQGELYIKVDGGKTASGASFTLAAGT